MPGNVSAFAGNTSAFDLPPMNGGMMSMGGPGDGMVFQTMAPTGPPPSLFEMAQHGAPTPEPVVQLSKPDPFAALSMDGIKKGFESPVRMATPITSTTITPSASIPHITPTSTVNSGFGDDSAFTSTSNGGNADFDFADFPDPVAPSPQPTPPPTQTPQMTPVASIPASPAPQPTPEPAQVQPKSAEEFLSSIDLNGPPKARLTQTPEPAQPKKSYTNETLVKSNIDWSKQRDLMASFLAPQTPVVEATPPSEAPASDPKPTTSEPTEDWGDFDAGEGQEQANGDWSGFETSAAPVPPTSANPDANIINSNHHSSNGMEAHLSTNESNYSAHSAHSQQPHEAIAVAAPAFEWNANGAASAFDTSAFDTSAFDTSAFQTSSSAFDAPIPSFPDHSASLDSSNQSIGSDFNATHPVVRTPPPSQNGFESPAISEVPIVTPIAVRADPSEPAMNFDIPESLAPSAHTETSASNESKVAEDLFQAPQHSQTPGHDDFGSFTSTTPQQDDDWSAFESDGAEDSVDFDAPIPALNLPSVVSPSADTVAKLPKRKSETKIWDISSFELPSTPVATPTSSRTSSTVSTNVQPVPFSMGSSSSLLDDSPVERPITPVESTTPSNDLWSLSAPTGNFDAFPSQSSSNELPSWMNSNRSEDSTPNAEAIDWKNQPTTDELKQSLLSLLGTEKAAPFMWIFDNMSKSISISFEDRHALALGLIEDIKSERVMWLSSSRINQWHSLLSKCNEDILKASSYMSDVVVQADGHPDEVMRQYLVNPKTLNYLTGVTKIYRVASRVIAAIQANTGVHATSQTPRTTTRYIKPSVLKAILALGNTVENSWNALVEQIKLMEEDCGTSSSADDSPALRALLVSKPVPHAPLDFNCYVCYRGFDEHEGSSQWMEKTCHATCANYWISRVSNRPPPL